MASYNDHVFTEVLGLQPEERARLEAAEGGQWPTS
jgi:hypothetical protein